MTLFNLFSINKTLNLDGLIFVYKARVILNATLL